MPDPIEAMARAIARANGDEFANAFKNKPRWVAKRGMSGGRFRDVNEPFQDDYMEMATAALRALRDNITPEMVEAGKAAFICAHPMQDIASVLPSALRAMIDAATGDAG